jgi:hypothetical protein
MIVRRDGERLGTGIGQDLYKDKFEPRLPRLEIITAEKVATGWMKKPSNETLMDASKWLAVSLTPDMMSL